MRVMVTGSAGFLGRELVRVLAQENIDYVEYDLAIGDDLLKPGTLADKLAGVTEIIHLAAIANLNEFRSDRNVGNTINVTGSRNVIEIAEQRGIPVLFACTTCSYGANGEALNRETSPICPTEDYAKSKVLIEKELLAMRNRSGIPHVSMRLCTFYGGRGMRADLVMGRFIDKVCNHQPVQIFGTGRQRRCYGHYTMVISGIIAILRSDKRYDIVNVAPSKPYSVWDVLSEVMISCQKIGESKLPAELVLEMVEGRGVEEFDQGTICNQRLRELGWRGDCLDLSAGIEESVRAYVANGYRWLR